MKLLRTWTLNCLAIGVLSWVCFKSCSDLHDPAELQTPGSAVEHWGASDCYHTEVTTFIDDSGSWDGLACYGDSIPEATITREGVHFNDAGDDPRLVIAGSHPGSDKAITLPTYNTFYIIEMQKATGECEIGRKTLTIGRGEYEGRYCFVEIPWGGE